MRAFELYWNKKHSYLEAVKSKYQGKIYIPRRSMIS